VLPDGKQFGGRTPTFRPSGQQTCPFEQSALVVQYVKLTMHGAAIMGRSRGLVRGAHRCAPVQSESERQAAPSSDSSARLPQPNDRSHARSPGRAPRASGRTWHSLKRRLEEQVSCQTALSGAFSKVRQSRCARVRPDCRGVPSDPRDPVVPIGVTEAAARRGADEARATSGRACVPPWQGDAPSSVRSRSSLQRWNPTLGVVVRSRAGSSNPGGRRRVALGKLSDLQARVLAALAVIRSSSSIQGRPASRHGGGGRFRDSRWRFVGA
jgi:hypothetical protein